MDALLRGHVRREDARAARRDTRDLLRDGHAGARGAEVGAHLDADALSAFAEQALPDATRARYAAHLADCDDCRRVATQVALTANVALARDEPSAVAVKISGASWRERLAALFAPRAWRYAMPVVALLSVGVVALILMKSVPRGGTELARRNEQTQSNSSTMVAQEENHALQDAKPSSSSTATTTRAEGNAANVAESSVARNAAPAYDDMKKEQAGGAVAGAGTGTAGAVAPTVAAKQPRVEEQNAPPPSSSSVVVMATPVPVPPPPASKPSSNEDEIKVAKDASKEKSADLAAERAQPKQSRKEGERNAAASIAVPEPRSSNRAALRPGEIVATPGAKEDANAAAKKTRRREAQEARDDAENSNAARDKSSTETRAVGGRKFRRDGDAWVDTAYHASQATTNVRRNSEQYRALVADEPELGRIAGALGGEVVVVWKGRAYRIKP
ncbi:MAG: hypothetical protein QOF61_597 [Acidobacteriota bacterium]|nr:hypothetical protein [Acidobacteriota bacterium]